MGEGGLTLLLDIRDYDMIWEYDHVSLQMLTSARPSMVNKFPDESPYLSSFPRKERTNFIAFGGTVASSRVSCNMQHPCSSNLTDLTDPLFLSIIREPFGKKECDAEGSMESGNLPTLGFAFPKSVFLLSKGFF